MTTTEQDVTSGGSPFGRDATDNLWLHFSRMSAYADAPPPVIVRGEGARIFDDRGRSYLDGLAGLFVVQVGHGRRVLAEAAAKQAEQLAFFPIWSYAHPSAIELSHRLPAAAPAHPNPGFFPTRGGRARRSQPGFLPPRRRRGRRARVEGRQAVLQAHRQADEDQGHQPGRR